MKMLVEEVEQYSGDASEYLINSCRSTIHRLKLASRLFQIIYAVAG